MRIFYSFLIAISTPAVLLYFALRGVRDSAYFSGWGERFGFVRYPGKTGGILLHAASVGEFNAAKPLINALLKTYPELPLTVTTLTPTGAERVRNELGNRVFHAYIPLDLPSVVSRFMKSVQPRLIIVMETEIWPNFYLRAQRQKIPLMMANARLSEISVSRYQRLSGLIRSVLRTVAWVGAQSEQDAKRLISCGAVPESTEITGNLKFEVDIPASLWEKGTALRAQWPALRRVLIAGSTHEADENVIIPAFTELLENLPDALLILVPRHPERFGHVAQAANAAGLRVQLLSQGAICSGEIQCFVVDAMGELIKYYACADIAFVGGSIGHQGGHNPLEPAALGKPVIVGPNMANASEITTKLLESGAAMQIRNRQEFRDAAEKLLVDGNKRDRMGQAGLSLIEKNKGALELTLAAIRRQLN